MDRMELNMHGATCLWNRNGVYYFRIRIPDDLKPHYPGKTEIRFSLKTSDKRDAIVRAAAERSKVLIEFSTKRKLRKKIATERNLVQEQIPVQTVDTEFIEYVCASRLRATLEQDDEFRPLFGPDWRSFVSPAERDREFLPRLKRALADGDTEWIRPVLEAHLHILGFTLQCGQEHYRPLAYRFMQTLVKEYEVMLSRDEGNSVETNVVASSKSLPKSALTLDDMFTSWSTATTRPTKTVKSFERAVTRFSEFLKAKSPELVTRKDVLAYRNHLLKGTEERQPLKLKAVKTQLDFLKAIFRRALANEQISNNPFHDIPFDRPAMEKKPRVPFEPADLAKIFSTTIYTHKNYNTRAGGREASYWLPLIALFSGARLEEIGQLRIIDIKEHPTLGWYFDISPDAGSVKTKSSDRWVPLHPELIELGLLAHVSKMHEDGHERLFPFLKPDISEVRTGNWSKWFGRHLDSIGITDSRKVFHSFRHGFKEISRAVQIPEAVHDAITGHASGQVGRQYGNERYPLEPLMEAIKLIKYPGLDLTHLKVASSS